ncbi:MAG: SPOR domain-containing protein [Candidatus Saganbacteria bacterium]|nr:SPOR domain-containing protein [Candidatus Saganbacteria bacterium]
METPNQDQNQNPNVNPDEDSKLLSEIRGENSAMAFFKKALLFLLLVGIIIASFWVSFQLGKKILVPVKKMPKTQVAIIIPEPPPNIAALQAIEGIEEVEAVKAPPKEAVKTVAVKSTTYYPTASPKYYKVQAGYFLVKSNADNLAKKIKGNGFDTYVKRVGRGWRVQVGAFNRKSQALSVDRALTAKGFESIIVYE